MSQTKAQLIDNLVQALSFTGTSTAPANGLFLSATNTLALSTNSAERLKIDGTEIVFNDIGSNIDFRVEGDTSTHLLFLDASADRVGIGTSSPSTIFVVSNAGAEGLEVSHSSGTVELNAYNRSGSARSPVDIVGQTFAVKTGNPSLTTGLYQDSSGKVHIGLTNGAGQFNVKNSNDATTNAFEVYNDNGVRNAAFSQSSAGDATMDLRTNAASQTVLLRSNGTSHFNGGNVGIGTDSPDQLLHLSSTGTCKLRLEDKRTSISNTSQYGVIQFEQRDSNTPGVSIEIAAVMEDTTNGASGLQFKTGTPSTIDERVRIDRSGNVGIGTTSPAALLNLNVDTESNLGSGSEGIRLTSGSSNAQFVKLGSSYSNNSVTGPGTLVYSSNKLSLRCDNDNPITFHTGSTVAERVRIDSSGRLLIGTTASLSFNGVGQNHNLIVAGSTTDTDITDNSGAAITISNTDGTANNTAGLHFAREDTDGTPHYDGASIVAQFLETMNTGQYPKTDLAFLVAPANNNAPQEKMRLKAAGHLSLTTGNLEFASGAGIDFSAVSDGSRSIDTDGNKFDDYEEGSFTPTLTCQNSLLTASYVNQDGKYTKIGRMVYFQIYIRLSAKSGGSGQLRVSNLPFTSSATSGAAYGGAYAAYTFNWDNDALDRMMIGSGSNQIQCFIGTSNGTNVNAGAGNLNSDTQMRILGSYHV